MSPSVGDSVGSNDGNIVGDCVGNSAIAAYVKRGVSLCSHHQQTHPSYLTRRLRSRYRLLSYARKARRAVREKIACRFSMVKLTRKKCWTLCWIQ